MSSRSIFASTRMRWALVLAFALSLPAVTTRFYASDEVEFYAWLRSATFDRDADFTNEYQYFYDSGTVRSAGFRDTFLTGSNEAGRRPNFTPIGTAVLWAPFFAGWSSQRARDRGASQRLQPALYRRGDLRVGVLRVRGAAPHGGHRAARRRTPSARNNRHLAWQSAPVLHVRRAGIRARTVRVQRVPVPLDLAVGS